MTDETPAAPTTMKPSMPDGSGDTPAPWKPSRIAVIAVHGVGHADAGGTVRHLADLLLGLGRLKLPPNPPGHEQVPWNTFSPPYLGFKTQPIQVPLRAAPITGRQTAMQRTVDVSLAHSSRFKRLRSAWLHLWHFLDERRGYIAGIFASNTPPATLKDDLADRARLGHEFMRAQLAGYVSEPDGKSYDTIRLEAARPDDGAPNDRTKDRTVHLYEAYWADLARPQNSILSFMLAFYQLLLHLGSLSRTAIDYAVLEHYEQRSWRWHAFWQSVAVRFLVLPLPILNLYLLLAGLAGLPLKLPWDHCLIAAFVVGAMALAAILYWPTIRNAPRTPWSWMGLLAFAFLLGGIAGYFLALHVMRPNYLLAIEWWLLGGALLYVFVLKPYDDVRRGAARVAQGLYVLCSAAFFYCLWQASGFPYSVDQAGFWTMQILMCGVILSWLGTLLSALFAYALHFICLWNLGGSSQSERLRARAALRTGRLTLAVSASLFLVMTIFLWSGLYAATRQRLNLHAHVQVVPVPLPRPVARVFRAIVPTPSDAIRWTHPADPRPLEIRVTNLEKDNWASSAVCQRVDPAPSSCPPAKPPQPIIPKTALPGICGTPPHRPENGSTTDLPGRLTYLEQQAAVDTTEDRLHPRWMASLDNESRVFRLELRRDKDPQKTLDTYANALMLVSSTAGLHILLICFGLALGLLIWAVVPCLLVDTLSLTDASKFNNRFSRRLGDWYSRGLDSTRAITFLLWHAIFSLAFVFGGLGFAYAHGWMDTAFWLYQRYPCVRPVAATLGRFMQAMTGDTLHVLSVVGASLAVSGAVIATAAYKKGGVVLDIILDVDHYLRTSPLKSAPRARIAERYTSLLRYIAQQVIGINGGLI